MRHDLILVKDPGIINKQAIDQAAPAFAVSNFKEVSRGGVPFKSPIEGTMLTPIDLCLLMQLHQSGFKVVSD